MIVGNNFKQHVCFPGLFSFVHFLAWRQPNVGFYLQLVPLFGRTKAAEEGLFGGKDKVGSWH